MHAPLVFVFVMMLAPALLAPARAAPTQVSPEEEFRGLCEAQRESTGEFYGRAQLGQVNQYLDGDLPDDRRVRGMGLLATHRLRLGEADEALRLLEEAHQIARRRGLRLPLRLALLRDLGLTNLRLGEVANCIGAHGPAMCLYPVLPAGVHPDPRAASRAVDAYLAYLDEDPGDPTVRWLLNVAAMVAGRFPDAVPAAWRVRPPGQPTGFPRFAEVATERKLHVSDVSGGGVMEDLDGDGRLDVATSSADPCTPLRFFRGGRDAFSASAQPARLAEQLGGLNMLQADYDDDGFVDLLVLRGGWLGALGTMRNSLLRNNGDGTFEDVTRFAGLDLPAYPTQTAAWGDFDGDGDLDLYVGNEHDPANTGAAYASQLFRNEGNGTFRDVASELGVTNDRFAKGVAWGDADDDGDIDLYVSNVGPNRLYRNDGRAGFIDVAPSSGLTQPEGRSFATWFFDIDNDGGLEIFVADYSANTEDVARWLLGEDSTSGAPVLYARENGRWKDRARASGLTTPALPMGANYGDLDNDGWLDFYLGTGLPSYESLMPNLMYRNDGGKRFVDVSADGGFGHLQKGHGVAFGDYDGDGDQDVFEQMGGAYPGDAYPSVLYENPGNANAWVTLRFVGRRANRHAVGASVDVWVDDGDQERRIHRVVGTGGSFGGNSLQLEVGLGAATRIERLSVRWPGGARVDEYRNLPARRIYVLRESALAPVVNSAER